MHQRNAACRELGRASGDIDLVMRRSLDGGRSREPTRVIVDTGPDTASPAPALVAKPEPHSWC